MSAAMVAWPSMKIGLIGLAKSGKTSLFNLLTGASVATSSFGGARAEMHAGVARVPDARVDRLTAMFKPKKTTFATFEVVDLAGIAKGNFTLEIFANNALDKRAETYRFAECTVQLAGNPVCGLKPLAIINTPRTIGIRFGQRF